VVDRLPREGPVAFRDEEPRQVIQAHGQPAPDGAQFIAGDRMLTERPFLRRAIQIGLPSDRAGFTPASKPVSLKETVQQIVCLSTNCDVA
jgi:hypothetical protein